MKIISTRKCPRVREYKARGVFDNILLIIIKDYNNQEQLIIAANVTMADDEHDRLLNHARTISRELGIDKTLKEYGVDVIIAPADSAFNLLVSSAGMSHQTDMPNSTLILVCRLSLCDHAIVYSRLQRTSFWLSRIHNREW